MNAAVTTARKARRIMMMVFAIAIVNFVAFGIGVWYLGGDAFSGKIEQDRFYVAYKGRYTEVNQIAYYYSLVHMVSVVLTHVAAILVGLCAMPWLTNNQGRELR